MVEREVDEAESGVSVMQIIIRRERTRGRTGVGTSASTTYEDERAGVV